MNSALMIRVLVSAALGSLASVFLMVVNTLWRKEMPWLNEIYLVGEHAFLKATLYSDLSIFTILGIFLVNAAIVALPLLGIWQLLALIKRDA
jgi:hypothetical protein